MEVTQLLNLKDQEGSALILALFILVFAIILATAVLPMVRQEVNYSPVVTERTSAEYLAQQGVQCCVRTIQQRIDALTAQASTPGSNFITTSIDPKYAIQGNITAGTDYSVKYTPTFPASSQSPNGFKIISTGTVKRGNNTYTTTITAWEPITSEFHLGTDPSTLFTTQANYASR